MKIKSKPIDLSKCRHLYPFESHFMDMNGFKYHYVDQGSGPPVIMVHGNPTWSFYYRRLIQDLSPDFRAIAVDHIGCGLSDKPTANQYDYTLDCRINDLERFICRLELKEKITLVVHDWGGAIGMGLAARKSDRVKSIVVMNTAAFRSQSIPLRISLCRIPILGDIIVRGFNGFAKGAVTMAVTKKMSPEIARGYISPYNSWENRIALLRFVQDIPLSRKDKSWDTLVAIEKSLIQFKNTPILVLWGGKDFCFTRHFYDEWLQRFPGAKGYFFPDAGHYVLEDAFDSLAPLITTFFQKHSQV